LEDALAAAWYAAPACGGGGDDDVREGGRERERKREGGRERVCVSGSLGGSEVVANEAAWVVLSSVKSEVGVGNLP
jgi:hypothetical protein